MENNLIVIGHVETPYKKLEDCPRNIDFKGPECRLVLRDKYEEGILGLHTGDQILILYWLDGSNRDKILQARGWDDDAEMTGTFSLRSPHRPNPIGAAIVPIKELADGIITVQGLDCLDGTQLLDIKPAIKLEKE